MSYNQGLFSIILSFAMPACLRIGMRANKEGA